MTSAAVLEAQAANVAANCSSAFLRGVAILIPNCKVYKESRHVDPRADLYPEALLE